jgi:diguanylate cyclase (GGDEF)-like protein
MLRRSDFLARTEGEEFAVIFTNTPEPQAKMAAEKIRRLVAKTPVDTAAGSIAVTASIGVAELRPGDSPTDLHQRATQLLSRAQRRSARAASPRAGTTTH